MSKLATYITKEDFKRALNDCFKEAWVWHSAANFKAVIDWQDQQELIYYGKETIQSEEDFNSSGATIDLVKLYQETTSTGQGKFLAQFQDPEGFSYERFPGETLADGFAVGEKARTLFTLRATKEQPQLTTIDLSDDSFPRALEKTAQLLELNPLKCSYGFELAFAADDQHLKIRPDVLRFKSKHHVDIIEIKATSKPKAEHFFDLAYQIYVLEKNGLVVDNAYLGHLNPDFIWGFEPENINLSEAANQLYRQTPPLSFAQARQAWRTAKDASPTPELYIDECLEDVFNINPHYKALKGKEAITYIAAYRQLNQDSYLDQVFKSLTDYFALPNSTIKAYLAAPHCKFKHKYKVNQKEKGWVQVMPEPFCYHILPWFDKKKESIFDFTGASNFTKHHKAMIYHQTNLIYLSEINSLATLEAQLSAAKKPLFLEPHYRHFQVYKDYLLHRESFDEAMILKQPLSWLEANLKQYRQYPLLMYDFETAKWAIPRFPKTKAYQQIPFQYSLDVLINENSDYRHPETIKHHDFLACQQTDPRLAFINSFLEASLQYGPGKYVAYNDAFEKTILKHLAFLFPQYQVPLLYIVQNTIDLMTFFKGKKEQRPWFEIYHPDFHGSYSIKKTQPALEPNFSYGDLAINKGDQASQIFRELVDGYLPLDLWREKVYPDLLSYCNRDTLAMVVLLQRINEIYLKGSKNDGEI